MKRVTFEIAKALKEAGYPQYGSCDEYYNHNGQVVSNFCDINKLIYPAPTYLEVWLWLWRERHCFLECVYKEGRFSNYRTSYSYADPEEAIIAAIEHLVNIKYTSYGNSHEENTLAAIDAALDYLISNKK